MEAVQLVVCDTAQEREIQHCRKYQASMSVYRVQLLLDRRWVHRIHDYRRKESDPVQERSGGEDQVRLTPSKRLNPWLHGFWEVFQAKLLYLPVIRLCVIRCLYKTPYNKMIRGQRCNVP
jgi:hypothetical protein